MKERTTTTVSLDKRTKEALSHIASAEAIEHFGEGAKPLSYDEVVRTLIHWYNLNHTIDQLKMEMGTLIQDSKQALEISATAASATAAKNIN
jgi:hypothetical protein